METRVKVLVIDDDPDFVASVKAVLEAEGFEVVSASSGRDGLRLIGQADPDLIVCDIMMESSTEGYAVSGAVRFQTLAGAADIPFIMVSSIQSTPDELFPRAAETGAIRPDYYLTKPLDFTRFIDVVRKATGRPVTA